MARIEDLSCKVPEPLTWLLIIFTSVCTFLLIYFTVSFCVTLAKERTLRARGHQGISMFLLAVTYILLATAILNNAAVLMNEFNCLYGFFPTDTGYFGLLLIFVLIGCYAIQILLLITLYFQRLQITLCDSSFDYNRRIYLLFKIGLLVASVFGVLSVVFVGIDYIYSITFNIVMIVLFYILSLILLHLFTNALFNLQVTMFKMDHLRMTSIQRAHSLSRDRMRAPSEPTKPAPLEISKEDFQTSGPLMHVMTKNTVLVFVSICMTFVTLIISVLRATSTTIFMFNEYTQTWLVMLTLLSFVVDVFINSFCALLQFQFWDQHKYDFLCGKIDKCFNRRYRNQAIKELSLDVARMSSNATTPDFSPVPVTKPSLAGNPSSNTPGIPELEEESKQVGKTSTSSSHPV